MGKHTKRKIFSIAVIVICLSIAGTGTYAYFTESTVTQNVITTGKIDIAINNVTTEHLSVMPGTSVARPIIVTNEIASNDVWVRVKIDKAITKADHTIGDAGLMTLQYQNNGTYNSTHWFYKDGYYYYDLKLKQGESTVPLYDAIVFSPDMGNEYQSSKATVTIYAQGTQAAHNGTAVLEAVGWTNI